MGYDIKGERGRTTKRNGIDKLNQPSGFDERVETVKGNGKRTCKMQDNIVAVCCCRFQKTKRRNTEVEWSNWLLKPQDRLRPKCHN
ncbi:hypothetical protein DPMN_178686 [Dreissena polymorpha]|uniref:Uncharacterized protein n=1 Tax=Dreissena polymorpha TaxID=45954 RepID=A0A9D4IIX2_DREPO|nr:hypothetical protein DPMN_178686 [Dreissena polymorpha]